jgi:hypothetical protein
VARYDSGIRFLTLACHFGCQWDRINVEESRIALTIVILAVGGMVTLVRMETTMYAYTATVEQNSRYFYNLKFDLSWEFVLNVAL